VSEAVRQHVSGRNVSDAVTGSVKNQITKGNWVVRYVDRVDEEKRQVWFGASGICPNQNPYYIHLCRANFAGTGLTILTPGDGMLDVQYKRLATGC